MTRTFCCKRTVNEKEQKLNVICYQLTNSDCNNALLKAFQIMEYNTDIIDQPLWEITEGLFDPDIGINITNKNIKSDHWYSFSNNNPKNDAMYYVPLTMAFEQKNISWDSSEGIFGFRLWTITIDRQFYKNCFINECTLKFYYEV